MHMRLPDDLEEKLCRQILMLLLRFLQLPCSISPPTSVTVFTAHMNLHIPNENISDYLCAAALYH